MPHYIKDFLFICQNAHCLQHVVISTTSGASTHDFTCIQAHYAIGAHMPQSIKDYFHISKHIMSTVCWNIYKNTALAHMSVHAFKHIMS